MVTTVKAKPGKSLLRAGASSASADYPSRDASSASTVAGIGQADRLYCIIPALLTSRWFTQAGRAIPLDQKEKATKPCVSRAAQRSKVRIFANLGGETNHCRQE